MAGTYTDSIMKRIASDKSLIRRLLGSNQIGKIIVRDQRNATISIKVYDAAGKVRVYIGKKET